METQKINKEQYKITDKISKEVIEEVLKVEKQQGLTAENLLETAKDEDNVLNELFEWNDSKAGYMHRLQQARVIINQIEIVVNDKTLFGFENVNVISSDGEPVRVYKPVLEIMSNKIEREQIIKEALKRMEY